MKKDILINEIKGIEPYNKMNLQSCFYAQLFAGYAAFGVDGKFMVSNYYPIYKFDVDDAVMEIEEKQILDTRLLQKVTGVKLQYEKKIRDFKKFIKENIDKNRPIILPVDCYYLRYRPDTYRKQHIVHYVLVYGYDYAKNELIVNEHKYINSLNYERRLLDMSCLLKAHREYEKRLYKVGSLGTLILKKVGKPKLDIKSDIALIRPDIEKSKIGLDNCLDYVINCIKNEETLLADTENILAFLGSIRCEKLQQRLVILSYSDNLQAQAIIDTILNNYVFLYGVIAKMSNGKKLNEKSIEKALERCEEIQKKEKLLVDMYLRGEI